MEDIKAQGSRLKAQGSRLKAQSPRPKAQGLEACFNMEQPTVTASGKPFDLHERLLLFACDIVAVVQFLHRQGDIPRRLSYQLLDAGTSVGSNYEESDGASSTADFIAKNRIALKEAKETRFRLRVCRRRDFLDARFDSLLQESDEIVRILGKIVHNAIRRQASTQKVPRPSRSRS